MLRIPQYRFAAAVLTVICAGGLATAQRRDVFVGSRDHAAIRYSAGETNNAAAALMFPFALATSQNLGVSYLPFVIAVMMAASAGFATPIGYQTNLMVYGPGGYRFMDYVKIGLPLDVIVGVITIVLAPWAFPFK